MGDDSCSDSCSAMWVARTLNTCAYHATGIYQKKVDRYNFPRATEYTWL
jgi:hypothetical protein